MSDRICVERKVSDDIIKLIDNTRFLKMGKSDGFDRTALFIFAMAVGVHENVRTPLASVDGLVLYTNIPNEYRSMMYSVAIHELQKDNRENDISDFEEVAKIAQEYANTGFYKIKEWIDSMDSDYTDDSMELQLLTRIHELNNVVSVNA